MAEPATTGRLLAPATTRLDGGKGQDVLFGDAGNDVVLGGLRATTCSMAIAPARRKPCRATTGSRAARARTSSTGMAGDDVLIGGKGDDTMVGGAGRDTYIINKGDGIDTIIDDDTGPDKSIMVFGEGVRARTLSSSAWARCCSTWAGAMACISRTSTPTTRWRSRVSGASTLRMEAR
jgi:hypothetical protein